MRYTTIEKEAMANAVKKNDYSEFEKYLSSTASEDYKKNSFIKAGGVFSNNTIKQATPITAQNADINTSIDKDTEQNADINTSIDKDTEWLLKNYNTNIADLERNRTIAEQQASVSLAKLQKYLPIQLQAQGLGGLGVSELSMLQNYSDYNNRMGDIASNYSDQKTALDINYNNGKQEVLNSQQKKAAGMLDSLLEHYDSIDEVQTLYDSLKNKLSDVDKIAYQNKITSIENSNLYKETIEAEKQEKEFSTIKQNSVGYNNNGGRSNYSNGDNFSVKDSSGIIYRIESGGEVNDSALSVKAKDISDGNVFGYKDNLYIKKSGKIYLVQQRGSYKKHYDNLYKRIYG